MSQLINYIRSLPDQSFDFIRNHFTELSCKITEDGNRYMISVPNDLLIEDKPFLEQAVGSIFTKDTNNLLCFGFSKTVDVNKETFPINTKFIASEYIVGTLIRAYWDGGLWHLTTNRSMNAYSSFWISTKSFGELFDACLSRIYRTNSIFSNSTLADKLDKYCCYQFLLSDPTVHLQKDIKPYIYHVGTYDLKTLNYVDTTISNTIHKPITHSFNDKEELDIHLSKNKTVLGYILYTNSDSQTPRYRYLKESYSYIVKLIGNTPNMYLRYLECKSEGRDVELKMSVPGVKYYSSWVDKCIDEIVNKSYSMYVEKYIKRQPEMFVNYFYRPIIHDIHMKYNELRAAAAAAADTTDNTTSRSFKPKVTLQIVHQIVHSYHPKRLHFILNGLKFIETMEILDPTLSINSPLITTENTVE